jgi:hypothetical protein
MKFRLLLLLLLALCAPQCVKEEPVQSSSDAGAGGESVVPPIGEGAVGGETFGPVKVCAKRTLVSDCDPLDEEACATGSVCNHVPEHGGFKCYEDPEPAGAGEACDGRAIKCGQGLYCETYLLMVCQHYCCDDSDCEVGSCIPGFHEDGEATIGRCFDEYGGLCAFAIPGEEPEECLEGADPGAERSSAGESGSIGSAGAGGSAP